jgi:hypothetical protein
MALVSNPAVNLRYAAIAAAVTIGVGILCFVIAMRLSAYRTSHDIRDVIAAERRWRINKTNRAEVEHLVKKYARSKPVWCGESCDAGVALESWYPAWLIETSFLRSALGSLGIRPFRLNSQFSWSNDKLSDVYASYAVVVSDGSMRVISVGRHPTEEIENEEPRYKVIQPHLTSPPYGGLALMVRYGAEITPSEWQRAFGFNPDCMTRIVECTELYEYMPEAWLDSEQQRRIIY